MTTGVRRRVVACVSVMMLMATGGATEQGVLTDVMGGRYEGSISEEGEYGYPLGRGVLTWPDGRRFEGKFGDKSMWWGVYTWPDGTRYEGDLRGGYPVGDGVLTYPDGRRFEGYWSGGRLFLEYFDDNENGRGVRVWAIEGKRYEGEFRNGESDGQGVMTWPDGTRYEGEVLHGEPDGQGVMTWPDGQRFEGELHGTKFVDGHGVMSWPDGGRYEGGIKVESDGVEAGRGVYTSPDGARYEGEWRGFPGHGVLTYPDGRRVTCFPCTRCEERGSERAGCGP